jgi:hypothetical protein
MKTFTIVLAALMAVVAVAGAGYAQTATPAAPAAPKAAAQTPAATPAAPAAPAKAAVVKNLTGELVSLDKTAKTVTVKHVVDGKPAQMILSVDDTMLTAVGQLKAGDPLKVTYEEMGGKFIAKTIVKA